MLDDPGTRKKETKDNATVVASIGSEHTDSSTYSNGLGVTTQDGQSCEPPRRKLRIKERGLESTLNDFPPFVVVGQSSNERDHIVCHCR
jgi:hypothetical protein